MEFEIFTGEITGAPAEVVRSSTNPKLEIMAGTGGALREAGGRLPFRATIHCVAIVVREWDHSALATKILFPASQGEG